MAAEVYEQRQQGVKQGVQGVQVNLGDAWARENMPKWERVGGDGRGF